MPEWNLSQLYDDSLWYVVESPLLTEEGTGIYMMTASVEEYVETRGDKSLAKQVVRQIVMRSKEDGKTYAFVMVVMPELDYMLEKGESIGENKYLSRDSDLSGLVYFYTVDGSFVNGWMYEDGRIIGGTHLEEETGGTKAGLSIRTTYCFYQDTYVRGELIDTRYICETTYETIFTRTPGAGGDAGGGIDPGQIGGGGNNSNPPGNTTQPPKERPKEEPESPCENMKNKMTSEDFIKTINDLKKLTKGDYEAAMSYVYRDGEYIFTNRDGKPGEAEIKYFPTTPTRINGFIHLHYDGLLKTFSPSDLMIPYDWFMRKGGIRNLNSFSLGLVTSDGVYFLFVTDVEKYMAFGKMYSPKTNFHVFTDIYENYGITIDTDALTAMNNLFKFLEASNSGLSILKESSDGKSYERVTNGIKGDVITLKCIK